MINNSNSSRFLKRKFSKVFRDNSFHGSESLSGRGSDLDQTRTIEKEIPKILNDFDVTSMLDIPCGDQNWMERIYLEKTLYLGADIVPALILRNTERFGSENKKFLELDLTSTVPPKTDLILCRDLFVHLNTTAILKCLSNIRASGSTYLLSTTFTNMRPYKNLPLFTRGIGWRPINLQLDPFFLPAPIRVINENCTEGMNQYADKSLGLWRIKDL